MELLHGILFGFSVVKPWCPDRAVTLLGPTLNTGSGALLRGVSSLALRKTASPYNAHRL